MTPKPDSDPFLSGQITNQRGNALRGLIVRVYAEGRADAGDFLGEAVTDASGRYRIALRPPAAGAAGDLTIRVLAANRVLAERSGKELHPGGTLDLQIDHENPEGGPLDVHGLVRDPRRQPLEGILVRAYDRDLRSWQPLGETATDGSGAYQIEYYAAQFRNSEKGAADLVVKAFTRAGEALAESAVLFNAPPSAQIDLTVSVQALPPLFDRIREALEPLMEGVRFEELEEDARSRDLTFLNGETGFEKRDLARFSLSYRMAARKLPAEFWFVLLGGPILQYNENRSLKEQLSAVQRDLPSLDETAVRRSLRRGFNLHEIADHYQERVQEWIAAFLGLTTTQSLTEPTFVKLALDDAGITDEGKREAFARLLNERRALAPDLLAHLAKNGTFEQAEISDLQTSFDLADLTLGDFSVVAAIKRDSGIREPLEIRQLAKRSEKDWVTLVTDAHAKGEINIPLQAKDLAGQTKLPEPEVYGKMLGRRFREAFPTAAFSGGLNRALRNGGVRGVAKPELLSHFLESHADFELLRTPIDSFLDKDINPDFEAAARDKQFRSQLKAVQRVFKLAPTFEATNSLLGAGVDSAQKVYRKGRTSFVRQFAKQPGFTEESAHDAWNRAADTHAAVVTLVGDLKALEGEGLPAVLVGDDGALEAFPNWNSLFKSGDLCECEHCRSVLSPAAYFADLLMFLRDRKAKNPAFTVRDVLFKRRPDLGFLELNCENALTPLPYIDVVCEVLEDVVAAGQNDLELPGFGAMPADSATAKTTVAAAFSALGVAIEGDFTLSQIDSSDPDRWVVHADNIVYLLKKKGTPNFFAEILRNTKSSAAELRAYPQYVNPKAYEKLRGARYPLGLPFDLFAEETRAGFQKSNLQRWDLMRTFHGPAAPNNPSDGNIACEYFGISVDPSAPFDEKRLILVADPTVAGQRLLWGESGAGWLDAVGNVKKFLSKTDLEYNDLLALLDLEFINPDGDIVINHLDASCDLDQKVIRVLDPAKLDRMHRFLRLLRKLKGWKAWELDLVIRHPGIGNGSLDEAFLVNLWYLSLVKNRLGGKASIEQVCALLGDLNTRTRFTKLHEKRQEALYQNLFLNRRLIKPLDPAFQLDPATGDLSPGDLMTNHQTTIVASLGVRGTDFVLIKELTKASDGLAYVNDDLTLSNLSFVYRHAWLAKTLKYKPTEWRTILKIVGQDLHQFGDAHKAWNFIETIDQIKASGFQPDQLDWLLAANPLAKSAIKEGDASRFLAGLRASLQAIQAENDPAAYDFLNAVPPVDTVALTALLSAVLQKLNRDEVAAGLFPKVLMGAVQLEAPVNGLPVGFVFPGTITGAPNQIPIAYDEPAGVLRLSGMLTDDQRAVLLGGGVPPVVSGNPSYTTAIEDLFEQSLVAPVNYATFEVEVALPGGVSLPPPMPSLPIRYNATTQTLGFTGVMQDAERLALIGAGNPAAAIDELFLSPRMAVKFFQPVFTAPLAKMPAAIDFKAQLTPELASKVSYDAEQRLLRFDGIMSASEHSALDALSPNVLPEEVAYHTAVNSLASQPQTIVPPDDRIWLTDADLNPALPASDTLAKRLAIACRKGLVYLSDSLSASAVIQQGAAQLGLTEAVAKRLMTEYALLPDTLLVHLATTFAATSGVVDRATLPDTLDAWCWAVRGATILKKWNIVLAEFETLAEIGAAAQLLDFSALPLNSAGAIGSLERLLRTSRLLWLRDRLPETGTTLLETLQKLNGGDYATVADFAADVELLDEDWLASQVVALVGALDLAYPADYLLAESWERLRRAFYFLDKLNAGAEVVKTLAASTMSATHAKTLKDLLRSKLGTETWLVLAAEIQDALRERKRDALAAYLLTQPKPADAPSGKWENSNDLYAYYLLDVEMSACQLTSRLVQGSGSIQLFVQRCFMGLEPDVEVQADGPDGDSAWRWWKWMRKYRVWEANRKVFLWPENWIEPELKKDRSSFFKDLENDLQQNEVNQYTVEAAFTSYLEKLHGVAQLEIAGFYQEDDGDNTIVHVFGRTPGAEPHLYYYRRYDYRQWTPWERVDLDIQGDYLIPTVVGNRLFLFWPVFTEVPDEESNNSPKKVTIHVNSETTFNSDKANKKLRLQMAVSDYRGGKWSPRKISNDYLDSNPYDVEIVRKAYRFFPIDRSQIDGRFAIKFEGFSLAANTSTKVYVAGLYGAFEIAGCKGVPELADIPGYFNHAIRPEQDSTGDDTNFMKWVEIGPYPQRADAPQNDFTLVNRFAAGSLTTVLQETPWIFKMTPPWHLSYMDRMYVDGLVGIGRDHNDGSYAPVASWLPYFYHDKKRTFFVLPTFGGVYSRRGMTPADAVRLYYPDIKKGFRLWEAYFEGLIRTGLESYDLTALSAAERQGLDQFLWQAFPEQAPPPLPAGTPPYSALEIVQIKDLITRWFMRFVHYLLGVWSITLFNFRQFHFKNHYHPFVCDFAKLVYNPLQGIPALMSRETQLKDSGLSFHRTYQPTYWVVQPGTEDYYPKEVVDFDPDGAYAPYNWELFYHAPLLIANSLSRNQRFEEARDWYHFIFNPIGLAGPKPGGSAVSKYWITKPFFETTDPQYLQQRIDNILLMLAGDSTVPGYSPQAKKDLEDQVLDWRTNPFEPHRIANYRHVAYQKTVVMKYLDNLIAWGDYLFRQDSMESTNEATQLYIMAAEILGPPPKKVPPQVKPPVETFNELESQLDKFSNALVEVENLVPPMPGGGAPGADPAPIPTLYFCIPYNEKMLGYWDTVADRLYKLRHCMNIEGVVRQLSLFEPPIDPAALVKAVAGGLDISSALADLNAPLPLYRFGVLLQKANEVCADVKALGAALLTALEKKDAEAFALLRQTQEIKLLEAVKSVREQQIAEAKESLAALQKSKELAEIKKKYYESREFMNSGETVAVVLGGVSIGVHAVGAVLDVLGGALAAIPDFDIGASGFGGSPVAKVKTGGSSFSKAVELAARALYQTSTILDKSAALSNTLAGYTRRKEEWDYQRDLAVKEMQQLDKSIAAAGLRVAIAEKELSNQELMIDNAKASDDFMRSKYTNQELYQWQIGQISGVYFQSYKLAYDLAKRAERCLRYELGLANTSYINFGYWDSLKKGLLSGEKLQYDLRHMESAYIEQNRREFELTKQLSLALLDPLALLKLRETGRCFFRLPEELFDLDFPGHYFRRIKSVSLTLPSVTGPYTTVSCTLRLLKNSIRINTASGDNGYPRNVDDDGLPADDARFVESNVPVKAIATGGSQNDSGVFELNFRDERYLPFEGAGAISEWSLELFNDLPSNNPDPSAPDFGGPLRQFDYETLADAVLTLRYTAREDAGAFKNGAVNHLREILTEDETTPSVRMFDLRREFPAQWQRFLNPTNPVDGNVFDLDLSSKLFRVLDQGKELKINSIALLARCTDASDYRLELTLPDPPPVPGDNQLTLVRVNQYGGLHLNQKDVIAWGAVIEPYAPAQNWKLKMSRDDGGNLQQDPVEGVMEVKDLFLVVGYDWDIV